MRVAMIAAGLLLMAGILTGQSYLTQKSTFLDQVDPRLTPQQRIDEDFTIVGMARKIQDSHPPTPQQRIDGAFEVIDLGCHTEGRRTVCTDGTAE